MQMTIGVESVLLTTDERAQAGLALAEAYRRLLALDAAHAEQRAEMRKAREALLAEIVERVDIVRTGRQERPVERPPR